MPASRIQELLDFLDKDPQDPFILYALALEYQKIEPKPAKMYFELLIKEHPKYVATYYHAAKLYAETDEIERAREIYKLGVEVAEAQGDALALRELKSAWEMFEFENE